MRLFYIICLSFLLSACGFNLPSFSDPNQDVAIIDIRQDIINFNCDSNHQQQLEILKRHIQWFALYSEAKGKRQNDVLTLIEPMKETTEEFYLRTVNQGEGSKFYCETKKKILNEQSKMAAEAVLRRF